MRKLDEYKIPAAWSCSAEHSATKHLGPIKFLLTRLERVERVQKTDGVYVAGRRV